MRVIYSRPFKNNRVLYWSDLVPYNKVWRLGANEATEIEFFTNAIINGKKIPKGRYTMYAIVNERDWTFIINKETDICGTIKYEQAKDVVRITVPIKELGESFESLTINFEKTNTGINLVAAWGNKSAAMPITF